MVSLTTTVLLIRAAREYVGERKGFSKEEIVKRINEIKYLSGQKKVPKLTLRKEIIHLEHQLQNIFELEKKLLGQEKKESAKIALLKQEIALLKQRIATSEDKDLQKKVDSLSHLLGESLARQAIIEEVALTKKVSAEHKKAWQQDQQRKELIANLLERLQIIKRELENTDADESIILKILEKINSLEQKLGSQLSGKEPEAPVEREEKPRHKLIFAAPKLLPVEIDEAAIERELPLPPPPRITE